MAGPTFLVMRKTEEKLTNPINKNLERTEGKVYSV